VLADLVGGDHERLVLDRAGAQQDLPVLPRGGERERGRHEQDPRAADGEDPVELGKAQVVTDAHAELDALRRLGDDELLAGRLVLGLAVGGPAHLDIEHVDLAVDGLLLAVGPEVHGGVGAAVGAGDALGDRARDEVDAELARGRGRPLQGRPVDGLGAGDDVLGRAQHRPLLGQHHELGAGRGGLAGEPVGGREIAVSVRGRGELYGGSTHCGFSSSTD